MAAPTAPHPKPAAAIEIERLGFSWHEVAEYDLSLLDKSRRIQVRDEKNYAPKAMQDRFAVQMGEVVFPPGVITQDNWIVDCNTRVGARLQRGDKFMHMLVVEVDWDGARTTESDRLKLRALAAILNSNGGKPLEKTEAERSVRDMIKLDWKPEQIARTLGLPPNRIALIKRQMAGEERLAKVGFETDLAVRPASLRALGNAAVRALNDTPYKELAELAVDAGFRADEINAAAKEAKETGSDTGAIEHIRKLRTASEARIVEHRATGAGMPPASSKLRTSLGFLLGHVGRPAELLERSSDASVVREHEDVLRTSIALLQDVLKLQEDS